MQKNPAFSRRGSYGGIYCKCKEMTINVYLSCCHMAAISELNPSWLNIHKWECRSMKTKFIQHHQYVWSGCTHGITHTSFGLNSEIQHCPYKSGCCQGLRDGSLKNQFLPGRFLRDSSLNFSNGTVRPKKVGQFAQNNFSGRFTHFVFNNHFKHVF